VRNLKFLLTLVALSACLFLGCTETASKPKPVGGANADDAAGHSADAHHHVHGPMGGELFEVTGTDLKLECTAKYRDNLVMFYFYDQDAKTAKKIRCAELRGSYTAGDMKTVAIPATDAEDGMASRFEIVDEAFAIARKTTGVKLEFELDGKTHTIDIPKDPHG
jgi:hypothetical protein